MATNENIKVKLTTNIETPARVDIRQAIFDLDNQIEMMSSHADRLDYFVAIASGIICSMLDIFWVGDFNLRESRNLADEEVNNFVKKTAKLLGHKSDDLKSCVEFLEGHFPIPSDGNTPDFGGGLQHHMRDFAHHPTIVGLTFSLLTQFTEKSYGTDKNGNFIIREIPEGSKVFIGKDASDKIIKGTIVWFFHLVSDIAGSKSTAGLSGGTGIPGPILSLAKELSVVPPFNQIQIGDCSISLFLSKLFNGTLFAMHDDNGKIMKGTELKLDFRGELGIAIELKNQAIPVVANDCIVRAFYFLRRLGLEIKSAKVKAFHELSKIDWNKVKPYKNSTLDRMLTIATGVFSAIDITEAVATKKYWVAVNYVGVGRFAVAIGTETANYLKVRDIKKIKQMYERIEYNTFTKRDERIYKEMKERIDFNKLGLNIEQTEILYNLEYHKTKNDIEVTSAFLKKDKIISLKESWLKEWQSFMEKGFSSFVEDENAVLHWYSLNDLNDKILKQNPKEPWLRLALLEAMLFEPYYPLKTEKDKKGIEKPSKEYDSLKSMPGGYKKAEGDNFLSGLVSPAYCDEDYIKRLRKCYEKVTHELNEVLKTAITSISIATIITVAIVFTAGAFAPAIATALVGSQFAGLSGAALTSACLAYLGGGAVAAGGFGMAGGTAVIVGGGAILGFGTGAGIGGTIGAVSILGNKATIRQSAKLMVTLREIFLNDEHDLAFSESICEQYVNRIRDIENELTELRLKADVASKDERKKLKAQIKNAEESIETMRIARKSMEKFKSSFEEGMKFDTVIEL